MSAERFAAFTAYVRQNVDGEVADDEQNMARRFPELYQMEVPDDVDPNDLPDGLPDDYGPGHD